MHDDDPAGRRLKRIGGIAIVVALVIVALGLAVRWRTAHALSDAAQANDVASVAVVRPEKAGAGDGLVLPGTVQAFNSAPIFARTNGYVRRWLVDIGERVRSGQVLAILDAPEVDQQLSQSRANYQVALANQRLAKSTAVRWQALLAKDAVSRQEADEKAGDLAAKTAVANAALADTRRLSALYGFTQITAPFAGAVTSRSAQIGALVTVGSATAQPLFTVSDVHRIRVFVRVPQASTSQIAQGLGASLEVPEFPGRRFPVTVTRSAGAVDPQSGTMLVELQADNGDGALKPGSYAQVHFPGRAVGTGVRIPASALMVGDSGTQVAVVDDAGRVAIRHVTIGRDEGRMVQISVGLTGRERIVDSPPDALQTGDRVTVVGTTRASDAAK